MSERRSAPPPLGLRHLKFRVKHARGRFFLCAFTRCSLQWRSLVCPNVLHMVCQMLPKSKYVCAYSVFFREGGSIAYRLVQSRVVMTGIHLKTRHPSIFSVSPCTLHVLSRHYFKNLGYRLGLVNSLFFSQLLYFSAWFIEISPRPRTPPLMSKPCAFILRSLQPSLKYTVLRMSLCWTTTAMSRYKGTSSGENPSKVESRGIVCTGYY